MRLVSYFIRYLANYLRAMIILSCNLQYHFSQF